MRLRTDNINLFDSYDNLMFNQYYFHKYGDISSCYNCSKVDIAFNDWMLKNEKSKVIHSGSYSSVNGIVTDYVLFDLPKRRAILKIGTGGEKNVCDVRLFYSHKYPAQGLVEKIDSFFIQQKDEFNKISLVIVKNNELTSHEFVVKIGEINIGMNYGDDFLPIYEKIVSKLNCENEKGLVLFHGLPGTGKTSLIKYITKHLSKEVLFIPSHLGESLSSPDFLPFLMRHPNSILLIEDAERIISDRDIKGTSAGVSNILNISDGILGDCLNIQIVATFNTKRDRIDQALLRKGRLIAEHEFGKLDTSASNRLLSYLGKNHITKEPMTLTDIYNFDEPEYKEFNLMETIGFRTDTAIPEAKRY